VALEASRPYSEYERRVLMITDGKQEGTCRSATHTRQPGSWAGGDQGDAWGVGHAWEADQLRTIAHTTGGEADVIPDAAPPEAVEELFTDVQSTIRATSGCAHHPVGTQIRSVRQVYPSVQDRAAQPGKRAEVDHRHRRAR